MAKVGRDAKVAKVLKTFQCAVSYLFLWIHAPS